MAFLGALAPYAASAASSLIASQAPHLAKLGSKILAHGAKRTVPEILNQVRTLAGSQAGREKLLRGAGKASTLGTQAAAEVFSLLHRNKILGQAETARHMGNIAKVSGGLQYALGKLSKLNRRFG